MQESGEMYLETILVLARRTGAVRAVDVADEMHISKCSVSRALSRLKTEECITVEADGHIAFTDKGRAVAEKIYERHEFLSRLLMRLGVPRDTAMADACKIEHDISDVSFGHIKRYFTDDLQEK